MIVRSRPGFMEVMFAMRGSVLPMIAGRLIATGVIAVLAVLLMDWHPTWFGQLHAMPFTLIGLALSIFLSFRNTTCYARWWEARQLWGKQLISVRNVIRQSINLPEQERALQLRHLCGFCHGMAARLRRQDERLAISPYVPGVQHLPSEAPNPTDWVMQEMGAQLARLAQDGRLASQAHWLLEQQFTEMSTALGACERILNTPMPFAYSLLLHRTAHIYCLMLPFALAGALGWWTPLLSLLVAYTFFGLDALGDELEEPFGFETNDLPLHALVRGMEREILAALGNTDLPPALTPTRNVLQ